VNEPLAREAGATGRYLEQEIKVQTEEARRREQAFDGGRRPPVAGRVVIIVDDGLATGATALAAARAMRAAGAGRVIVAVPVGPPHTIDRLRQEADEVVALQVEDEFWAIGQFYRDFHQVSDDEVKRLLDSFPHPDFEPRRTARVRRDGIELAARLILPHPGAPLAVFVHGLGSSKDSPRNVTIAERLFDGGIGSVLFDLSGHGDSSFDPRDNVDAYVDDTAAITGWAASQPGVDSSRIAVAGSSLGAVVALRAVRQGRIAPAALVLRAPPAGAEEFHGLTIPALLIVGSHDPLLANARQAAAASDAVDLRIVEGASHLFEEAGTLERAVDITVSWLASKFGVGERERASAHGHV
jgi:putative phosphoribosyl transferase